MDKWNLIFPFRVLGRKNQNEKGGEIVDDRQLKKLLAGLCISGLLAGASIAPAPTSAMGASG